MRYPVAMERWEKIWRQHADLSIPVLKAPFDIQRRHGSIAYGKRHPCLVDAVRNIAEDQASVIRRAKASPEEGKKLCWVETWPLKIDVIYEGESDIIKAWCVSFNAYPYWLSDAEAKKISGGEWPWETTIYQRPIRESGWPFYGFHQADYTMREAVLT